MNHELTQWKCFVPDTPSFYDHIRILKHNMMCHWLRDITLSSNGYYFDACQDGFVGVEWYIFKFKRLFN